MRLVQLKVQRVMAVFKITEQIRKIGVVYGLTGVVRDQVLLGHIGHVIAVIIFRQQMIKRLVFGRATVFGDRSVPVFGFVR